MRIVPVVVLLSIPGLASAATLAVGPAQAYTTIGDAVAAAAPGDRIEVDPGAYAERPVALDFDLEIVGLGGAAGTTWSSAAPGVPLRITDAAVVTLTGFSMASTSAQVVLTVEGSTLVASDLEIRQNRAGFGGDAGAIAIIGGSDVTIEGSVFDQNQAEGLGGAIYAVASTLTVRTTTFTANRASDGGAIYAETTDLVLDAVTFEGNTVDGRGGAVLADGGALTIDGSVFSGNEAQAGFGFGGGGGEGGALALDGSLVADVADTTFSANVGASTGGAIFVDGDAGGTFDGCHFELNDSDYGGALYVGSAGDVALVGSSFTANTASTNGGAVRFRYSGSATLTLRDSTFEANSADVGGVLAATSESGSPGPGGVVVDGGTFTANGAGATGGALNLANLDTVDVSHATFCANHADTDGGAVRVTASGGALHRFTNNVFSGNTAGLAGGGLHLDGTEPAEITNDTFLGNAAGPASGGGIALVDSAAAITNTLVAFGPAGDGLGSPLGPVAGVTVTFSAFWDNADIDLPAPLAGGAGNLFVDPQLTAWSDDGDCANDHVWPLAGSPLVDAGLPGLLDPDGSPSDIGAYGGPDADWTDFADDDQDGYVGAVDCDDAEATVHPDAVEVCDGIDQDCDGAIDDGATDTRTWYADDDGDGFGDESEGLVACTPPVGHVDQPGDCDDANAGVNPDAAEICDGIDDDCDAAVDEDVVPTWYTDADADGYGADGTAGVEQCDPPDGTAEVAGDCDDADPEVNPGAEDPEGDGADQNCDGADGVIDPDAADEKLRVGSGCGCASGGAQAGVPLLLIGLLALRRRR